MNRLSTALCLSLSIVAVGLASFSLVQNRPGGDRTDGSSEQELRDVQSLVASLRQKVEALEAKQQDLMTNVRPPPDKSRPQAPASTPGDSTDYREEIAALTQRLTALENDETIARLAQSGEVQVREKELRSALARVGDPDVSPDSRLEALKSLRRLGKTHRGMFANAMKENGFSERDVVLPMLELAQDTTLEPGYRTDVVRNLVGSKVEELRQPLLELLTYDEIPEVRESSIDALLYHLEDTAVQETITRVSQRDRHEAVQARAQRYLPKVEWVVERAAEAEAAADRGQEK